MLWAAAVAFAGGTSPEGRVEAFADAGVVTGELGLLVGVGAGMRAGGFTAVGTAGFGPRTDAFGIRASPAFGLGTLALGLDAAVGGDGPRIGVGLIGDAAVLHEDEEDCRAGACRHGLFVEVPPSLGISVQPAGGLRIAVVRASGTAFQTFVGLQPHRWYGQPVPTPRFDFALAGLWTWSVHAWAGRYGVGFGLGRRLSRAR